MTNPMYLTARWRSLRARILAERGRQCEDCGHDQDLILHHLDTGRNKPIDDFFNADALRVLCRECHAQAHPELVKHHERRAFVAELM